MITIERAKPIIINILGFLVGWFIMEDIRNTETIKKQLDNIRDLVEIIDKQQHIMELDRTLREISDNMCKLQFELMGR
mgnify:CR=1 FL=1